MNICNSDKYLFDDGEPSRFDCEKFHKCMAHVNFKGGGGSNEVEETADQQALAAIAFEKMKLFHSVLEPMENLYMGNVKGLKSDEARDFMTGVSTQNTEKSYGELGDKVKESRLNTGVNPNSEAFKSDIASVHRLKSSASGENQSLADNSQEDEYVQGMDNINAMGVGQSTEAQAGAGRLARISAEKASNDAENDYNSRASRLNTIGSLAGAGAYAYNSGSK